MRMTISWVLFSVLLGTAVAASSTKNHGEAQIEWIRAKGGFVNANIEIRKVDPQDPDSRYGMFAKDTIQAKEDLLVIPRDCLITAGDSDDMCDTTRNLIKELKMGDKSKFAPYVNYLNEQPRGQLPSAWSQAGKKLLDHMLGKALPPGQIVDMSWSKECDGSTDPFEENAYYMWLQRSWDDLLIPVFDMMSHRNGRWLNTDSHSVHDEDSDIRVWAKRTIEPDEELYTSYNFCTDCGNRAFGYGTPDILRDYGFVEDLPQRWFFDNVKNVDLAFELDEVAVDGDKVTKVAWFGHEPTDAEITFLEWQVGRLEDYPDSVSESTKENVPENELEVIWEYHKALLDALKIAWDAAKGKHRHTCTAPRGARSCSVASKMRYDKFLPRKDDYGDSEGAHTVDQGKDIDFVGYDKALDSIRSHYQEMSFFQNEKNKDTCFQLADIVQICGSYRPHYHEMAVDYTARYLDKVKRVLWVGGGDSMLLHEILKYPDLELAVGLELDQTVTRASFKHFGTQPHWDDDRVEWWYGDASKTLLMLPREYFGSFDMVLVDLSETVMSMSVTDELDIIAALALLLNPGGIFVKNELYLLSMSELFKYSLQLSYQDVPILYSQNMNMGSNSVDFIKKTLKEHANVKSMYVPAQEKTEFFQEILHDYIKNVTHSQRRCISEDESKKEPTEQGPSPGIIMILEAEDATKLQPSKKLKGTLENALKKEGLNPISSVVPASDGVGAVVAIVLREGYVVARTWPEHKYCAFDIHLWSRFEKHEAAKRALIAAVGSNRGRSSSSYRIVAGGMFGTSTWKDDEKNRGPPASSVCKEESKEEDAEKESALDAAVQDAIVQESLSLVKDSKAKVAVLCGHQTQGCKTLELLKKMKTVDETLPIWTCSDIKENIMMAADGPTRMFACEAEVLKALEKSNFEKKKIDAVILDPSAPKELAQIVHKTFKNKKNKKDMLAEDVKLLAPVLDKSEEWRRNFAERFAKDIIKFDPIFRAEVVFKSSDGRMELNIVSASDVSFFQHLNETLGSIEKKTRTSSDVQKIIGGLTEYDHDHEASQFVLPQDYNQSLPLEQWTSQHPLGRQTVFQMEWYDAVEVGDTVQGHFEDEGWFDGKVEIVHPDGRFDVLYEDGDKQFKVHIDEEHRAVKDLQDIEKLPLTKAMIKDGLQKTLSLMVNSSSSPQVQEFTDVGDGTVVVSLWTEGTAIVVWNGKFHVDLNLFTYEDDLDYTKKFGKTFMSEVGGLQTVLLDEQPRGFGRVVNFPKDIDRSKDPHWAICTNPKKADNRKSTEFKPKKEKKFKRSDEL